MLHMPMFFVYCVSNEFMKLHSLKNLNFVHTFVILSSASFLLHFPCWKDSLVSQLVLMYYYPTFILPNINPLCLNIS